MNRHSGINDSNNNKKDRTKEPIAAAIPMVGAIVTAALLLSGLSLISSYQQPAIAQQNMTAAGNVTNVTAAGNVTNATAAGNVTNATAAGNVTNATTTGNATNMTAPEGGDGGGILEDIFGGGGG
jgi:hypothetical protein